jgi:hypothetical protein
MSIIAQLEAEQAKRLVEGKKIPEFRPGDTVVVNVKVKEGERTRVQAYEGVVISRQGGGLNESFTVRKISYGARLPGSRAPDRLDQAGPSRQGSPRQALLPARPPRQIRPHRRAHRAQGQVEGRSLRAFPCRRNALLRFQDRPSGLEARSRSSDARRGHADWRSVCPRRNSSAGSRSWRRVSRRVRRSRPLRWRCHIPGSPTW